MRFAQFPLEDLAGAGLRQRFVTKLDAFRDLVRGDSRPAVGEQRRLIDRTGSDDDGVDGSRTSSTGLP
jgi:hypothetical protein